MSQKCSCGGSMTEGFIPDFGDMAATWVSQFVAGAPKTRASAVAKFFRGHGAAGWDEGDAWAITAFRCESCGRLDLFAKNRPDPELRHPPRT